MKVSTGLRSGINVERELSYLVVEKFGVDWQEVYESASWPDWGADEFDKIELIMDVERAFDMSIPDEHMGGLNTFGDLVRYVRRRTNQ